MNLLPSSTSVPPYQPCPSVMHYAVTHRSFTLQEVLHTLFFAKAGLMQTDWTIIDAFLFFSDFSHTIINSAASSVAFNNLLHTPNV